MNHTITITFTSDEDGNIQVTNGSTPYKQAASETDIPQKKKRRRNSHSHFCVDDEILLYKIADAGLLDKLRGVNFIQDKKVFFFDKDEDVKAIINNYSPQGEAI